MEMTSIVELGVAEAHAILIDHFGQRDLPPLDAIENEDWGRDFLLSRFESISDQALAEAGLMRDQGWDRPPIPPDLDGEPLTRPTGRTTPAATRSLPSSATIRNRRPGSTGTGRSSRRLRQVQTLSSNVPRGGGP